MKIAVRLDDITADMDWQRFKRMKELLDHYGIKPLLGVVPHNEDASLSPDAPKEDFYPYLRGLQAEGWMMAMHGYDHVYRTARGGLFPLNRFSEFAGVPYEEQLAKIKAGKAALEAEGIRADIFMAPGHSYDNNTLKALREAGFSYVTDGFGKEPYRYGGLTFLPISFHRGRDFARPDGCTTLVIHANTVSEAEFASYEALFEKYREQFMAYGDYLARPAVKRGLPGRCLEWAMAAGKQLAGGIRARSMSGGNR